MSSVLEKYMEGIGHDVFYGAIPVLPARTETGH